MTIDVTPEDQVLGTAFKEAPKLHGYIYDVMFFDEQKTDNLLSGFMTWDDVLEEAIGDGVVGAAETYARAHQPSGDNMRAVKITPRTIRRFERTYVLTGVLLICTAIYGICIVLS